MRSTRNLFRGFTLVELMIVVAIIGILAAVAIPAFMKYIKRSKTSEAAMNIKGIMDGATAYVTTDHADVNGTALPRAFPVNAAATPGMATATCAQTGSKWAGANALWTSTATWRDLAFSIEQPHYFVYTFVSSNNGAQITTGVTATVSAEGNLDCNTVTSLYRKVATYNTDGGLTLTSMAVTSELE